MCKIVFAINVHEATTTAPLPWHLYYHSNLYSAGKAGVGTTIRHCCV